MKTGELRRDDDCHWYLVPDDQLDAFDELMESLEGKGYMDAADQHDDFESRFGGFRVDGYAGLKVAMQEE